MELLKFTLEAIALTAVLYGLVIMVIDTADWPDVSTSETEAAGADRHNERGLKPAGRN